MRHVVHLGIIAALFVVSVGTSVLAQPGGGPGSAVCPEYLVAEFNGSYFYQEMDCSTGQMLPGVQRYMSKVSSGCNGTDSCNCATPTPALIQDAFANPATDIFVPFGRGASSYLGPAKRIIKAGEKTFVVISMRLKGKTTTVGAPDNEMDVIVEFGQEVDPSTNPTTNVGTLVDNTLTFGSQDFTVTLMGMGATQ